MFSPYHTSGFYYAPVSKFCLGSVILGSVAFTIPLNQYRYWFLAKTTSIKSSMQLVQYLCHRLVFLDPKDLMCASILLYHFRIFERRYGSRKFAGYLIAVFMMSLLLELLLLFTSHHIDLDLDAMPTGPFGMIFAMFVPYFNDLPRVAMTYFFSIPVTGKSLTYIVGLQMASGSLESALLAGCGVLAGLVYRHNALWVQSIFEVPKWIANTCHKLMGTMGQSIPQNDLNRPMGATLEIQRQQHIEQLEQQMAWAQLEQRPQARQGFGFGGLFNRGVQPPNGHHDQQMPQQHVPGPPPEEQVAMLVDMGFTRERVLTAMQQTHNDLAEATNLLLVQQDL